jgi:natural product biosynthesis luciferase-like monooxygenase protein
MDRFIAILNDCGAVAALTTGDMRRQLESISLRDNKLNLFWLESDHAAEDQGDSGLLASWRPRDTPLDAIAFLQYTSGSTAMPKGVMINHGSLVRHLEVIRQGYGGIHDEETFVSWLPVYHDMGLIGNVLQSAYMATHCVLMPPVAFVQKPVRWLNAISRYKGSVSGSPNFGYELCLQKISAEEKEKLDLSSWKIAFNGAEPVRSDTLARFSESFAPCGFRKEFLSASYGMAEAILLISCTKPEESPGCKAFDISALQQSLAVEVHQEQKDARVLSSCGSGYPDQEIRIVDPETAALVPPGRIGEIWIANPALAQGYWNKPQETEATFRARLAGSDEGPYLRTGDLGFLYQEELYITGRLKDLIIINGRNHYPQDIELTLERCHPALLPGGSAAFSVEIEGEERLVVVQEIKRSALSRLDRDAVVERIRKEVATQHEVEVYAVELVMPATLPKTSSGKLQRRLCRQRFLECSLEPVRKRKSRRPQPLVMEEPAPRPVASGEGKPMRFSLFYFSANEAEFQHDKYRLLLEGARIADQHGFEAVWVPERHFHAFGGIYPNPSVLASALAVITQRIRIRAGSVVLPLHNPIRIAEEWSVVDNLSGGRVDLALARGWNPNDFVFSPSNHAKSRQVLFEGLETLRRLWKGDSITVPNGEGKETEVRIYPLPKQKELALWITCSGSLERFVEAGEGGWNVLTALLFQSTEELGTKIAAYREARARKGHDPDQGRVTLMLHTYVGTDQEEIRRKVRGPFIEYLKTSVDLWRHGSKDLEHLTEKEREEALSFAFERYYRTSALFGTSETCLPTVEALHRVGVDEIACLIDFGVDVESVLDSLTPLTQLKDLSVAAHISEHSQEGRVSGGAAREVHIEPAAAIPIAVSSSLELAQDREEEAAWDPKASDNHELLRWSRQIITAVIADATATQPETVNPTKNFLSLGIGSVKAVQIIGRLEAHFGLKLPPPLLFEFPTVAQFAEQLVRSQKKHLMSLRSSAASQERIGRAFADSAAKDLAPSAKVVTRDIHSVADAIAVIGLSCRFPEAPGPAAFWDLLVNARDVVTEVPRDHWDWRCVFDSNPEADNKTYSRWGGFLRDIALFDAGFFNISPREARLLDPQQRLFLEVAWEAFEDAGYSPESLADQPVGVFVGASYNGYYQKIAAGLKQSDHGAGVGNQNAIIANRVSFAFNLRGPSVLVDTLCSSSLVALHLACQSLRNGECSAALAGGVNILLSPENYVAMSRMKAHSPDGRCKPFDHRANGIVFGEGAGALLLKPLHAAMRDGDNICAIIRGSAVNHGGQANGLLAPNPQAQAQVIRKAIDAAGISAASISYVEAHGTGTALGDPIEIEGLTKAFLHDTEQRQFCRIGSVKSNIGHLEAAAGIASAIKVILTMRHRQLPASLHFEKANPIIAFEKSPFIVNTKLCAWDSAGPRRAGVSSFGIGGSNAHLILEEPPVNERQSTGTDRPGHVLTLSAKSKNALETRARQYADFLQASPQVDTGDLCFTANAGRSHFLHRAAIAFDSVSALREKLERLGSGQPADDAFAGHIETSEPPRIAFLFTGQGSQYAGMARRLYETESTFRDAMDACQSIAEPWLNEPLLDALYSSGADDKLLREPVLAQIALFSLEVSLVKLWRSWGVLPDVVMGHSLGEYAAAHVAGVFTLDEGLKLVAERARLMLKHSRQPGAMAVIYADKDTVQESLHPWREQIAIAAFNGPRNIIISGEDVAVTGAIAALELGNITCERLKVTHAFHSPLLDHVLEPFEQAAKQIAFHAPRIPLIANLSGRIFEKDALPDSRYWRRQMREPVRFVECIGAVLEQECSVFLEIGPSASLVSMAKRCTKAKPLGVPSLTAGQDDWHVLLTTVAKLYAQGVKIDWAGFDRKYERRRISLPTYPFERERFWLDGAAAADLRRREEQPVSRSTPSRMMDVTQNDEQRQILAAEEPIEEIQQAGSPAGQAIHCLQWQRITPPAVEAFKGRCVVVAELEDELADRLVNSLRQAGIPCTRVVPEDLAATLPAEQVVCLWGRTPVDANDAARTAQRLWSRGVAMAQLLVNRGRPARLWWITRGAVAVTAQEAADVGQAALWGLGRAVMQEHPELECTLIDIEERTGVEEQLVCELRSGDAEQEIAWRAGERRVARLTRASESASPRLDLRTEGTVLITGGLGALGLHVARWLAGRGVKHLVLAGRRGKETPGAAEAAAELELLGAQVTVAAVDVSQGEEVRALLETIPSHLPLRGVVHAAGIGGDGLLLDQSPERFTQVLVPKVGGALNLDARTRDADLDFFILFSSVASTIVPAGRAAYAAANACLDALAARRCAEGLPGQSLAWSLWIDESSKGVGLASGMDSVQQARLGKRGLKAVDPSRGLALFEAVLGRPEAQLLLVELDLRAAARAFEGAVPSLWRELVRVPQRVAPELRAGGWAHEIGSLTEGRQLEVVIELVRSEVARVLSLSSAHAVGAHRPLKELGFDSLMAVELRIGLSKRIGLTLPVTLAFDYPTPAEIAKHIVAKLGFAAGDQSNAPKGPALVLSAEEMSVTEALGLIRHEYERVIGDA